MGFRIGIVLFGSQNFLYEPYNNITTLFISFLPQLSYQLVKYIKVYELISNSLLILKLCYRVVYNPVTCKLYYGACSGSYVSEV